MQRIDYFKILELSVFSRNAVCLKKYVFAITYFFPRVLSRRCICKDIHRWFCTNGTCIP